MATRFRQRRRPVVEPLEERRLLATITEFGTGITAGSQPAYITAGEDGNLWFTEPGNNAVARITPGGTITEFTLAGLQANSRPMDIVSSLSTGVLYFTENGVGRIGSIDPLAGDAAAILASLTQSAVVPSGSGAGVDGITEGPDGNLWFTEGSGAGIGKVTPNLSTINEYPPGFATSIATGPNDLLYLTETGPNTIDAVSTDGTESPQFPEVPLGAFTVPTGITAGPDGNIWFTTVNPDQVGRVTPGSSQVVTTFPLPQSSSSGPAGITNGPDGNLWFTESTGDRIGRITPAGVITEYSTGITAGSQPEGIVTGPDGNLWFTESGGDRIGRLVPDTAGRPTTTTLSAAPSTISFGEGVTLTAQVTVLGGGPVPGSVLFEDGHTFLGSATPGPVGGVYTAVLNVFPARLTGGEHSITASYFSLRDPRYGPSADTIPLTVSPTTDTTTITAASPASPASSGQPVTFTVRVTPSLGATKPTGSVTFMDGGTVLGSGDLAAAGSVAEATLTTAPGQLGDGGHTITASYAGDANFAASTSAPLSYTVGSASPASLQFSAAAYSVNEDGGTATVTLTRSGGSSGAVAVLVTTSDGTAVAGQDYAAVSQTVSWGDGDTGPKTVTVPVIDRGLTTGQHTVNLTLADPSSGAALGTPASAQLTIADNDPLQGSAGTLQFSASTYTAAETGGSVTITVTRSGGSSGPVSALFTTGNNTGVAGQDYVATTQTLSWADGDASPKTVTVPILDAHLAGGQRLVNLALSDPGGGAALGSPDAATLVIADNDAPSSDGSGAGGSSGGSNAEVVVVVRAGKLQGLRRASQRMTLTNKSGKELKGPLRVVLVGLSKRVKLRNASGVSTNGSPYVDLTADMAPSGSITITLQFSNPQQKRIKFTMEVIALGGAG
jgi:streptogramin lyase